MEGRKKEWNEEWKGGRKLKKKNKGRREENMEGRTVESQGKKGIKQ